MATATLSAKQRDFAHHYSASHNSAEAARAAGYSVVRASRTGYELLRKPDVAALISTLDDEKREASGVDEPWVMDKLVAIVEASMLGRPRTNGLGEPILDVRSGEPIVDSDFTNANRALQTLSKISGLQVHKSESVSTELKVWTLTFDRELDEDV
ncbi:MAG: terminase small subunit [Acidobacteria bacterium]|nr:terminase small subunit [Acidobacteriota bacterium]